jgi:arylsulfatase A-like enzyme
MHLSTLRASAVLAMVLTLGTLEAEPPNILFLFSDDQCFDTIRATGNREVHTPNLDRLVAQGTLFSHAYNMGSWSGAVCVPSRTMLNTGRFLWPAQRLHQNLEAEQQANRLWSQRLRQAGYTTYFTGKWHVNIDATRVFNVTRHIRAGMPRDTPQAYNRPQTDQPDPWSPSNPAFGGYWEGGRHWSEVVGDDALEFLELARQSTHPFFMYIAFNAPHDPRQSPAQYVNQYPLDHLALPATFLPQYPYATNIGCGPDLRDERLAPFPRTEFAVKVHRQEYYAIITHMDAQLGRILDALEQSPLRNNTYLFFTSDHGLAVGHHGLMGKQNLYDHSIRVPLIAVGPDIPRGRTIHAPVYLQDIMPTTLDLAGAPAAGLDFHSLLPLLRGQTDRSAYDAIYGAYLELQRAVTFDDHKLILYPTIPRARLFNLERDPLEMSDLADDPVSLPIMRQLFAQLLALQEQTGDALDLRPAFPELR